MNKSIELYKETLHSFQEEVKTLKQLAQFYDVSTLKEQFEHIESIIARDSFEIIVVGEFSNGKSTLINALLRERFLPSSINPTTAMLNKISYAPVKSYSIVYRDGTTKQMTEEQFKSIVAPDSKPSLLGNLLGIEKEKKEISEIREAVLGFPTDFCKNNITIIDSPGTNDFDAAREAITTHYIPRSDAAIFILNATKPFSESDKVFLSRILDEHLHKIFFVVNFKDLLENNIDEQTAIDYIKDQLAGLVADPKIYLISAQHALLHHIGTTEASGRRRRKPLLTLEQTGIPQFEQDLDHFLAYDTGFEKLVKLRAMYDETIDAFLAEHLQYERSMLQNATNRSANEIKMLEQKLVQLEQKMRNNMDVATSQIGLHVQSLKNWYHSELTTISEIALSTLDELYTSTADQAEIKLEIERRTGKLESAIPKKTVQKLEQVMQSLFNQNLNNFKQELHQIKNTISFSHSQSSTNWNTEFSSFEYKESYGGFFGGMVTWVRDKLFGDRRPVDVKAKMRSQVMERYSVHINSNVSNFESEMHEQLKRMIGQVKKMVETQIADERKRNQRALKMAETEQQEIEQKIAQLNRDILVVERGQQHIKTSIDKYMKLEV
ncbi:dynamin family protein [Solibacillus silvestris]|uniref:dynamin family protein n=1 Tax=Solibacillus silvestris TaxID=76853 RepID=UPI003F815855